MKQRSDRYADVEVKPLRPTFLVQDNEWDDEDYPPASEEEIRKTNEGIARLNALLADLPPLKRYEKK